MSVIHYPAKGGVTDRTLSRAKDEEVKKALGTVCIHCKRTWTSEREIRAGMPTWLEKAPVMHELCEREAPK